MKIKKIFNAVRVNRWLFSWVITFIFILNAAVVLAANERIMPLGDSITQADRYRNSYRRALWFKLQDAGYTVDFIGSLERNYNQVPPPNQDFDMDHEGHWGWRTDQLLDNLPAWLQGNVPEVVLLHAGTNDVFQQITLQNAVDNIKSIIDTLRNANPRVTILLAQLIPIRNYRGNAQITALNAMMPAIVVEKDTTQSPVIIVDQNSGFSASADTYDGTHPNAQGEQKIAQKWLDALVGVLPKPGDSTPPVVEQVEVNSNGTKVTVTFSEPVDRVTANNKNNFTIDQGTDLLSATLENDLISVTLTVSALTTDITYSLTVLGVRDLAAPPNTANDVFRFSFTPPIQKRPAPPVGLKKDGFTVL